MDPGLDMADLPGISPFVSPRDMEDGAWESGVSAKFFCDFCGQEITDLNRIKGSRLSGSVVALQGFKLGFEVIHAKDSVSNAGDWCKYCIIYAIKSLDDRPRLVA